VICPPSTLSTWKHEISQWFTEDSITYEVFHGPRQKDLELEDLQSATVVLTTYDMIGKSGNEKHPNVLTVGSLKLCWFRIVLDKAQ
jgi:SNF2 family DNA or RNA helicase